MDLDLSPEQEMLRAMVRGVCSSYSPIKTVRTMEDDPGGDAEHRQQGQERQIQQR